MSLTTDKISSTSSASGYSTSDKVAHYRSRLQADHPAKVLFELDKFDDIRTFGDLLPDLLKIGEHLFSHDGFAIFNILMQKLENSFPEKFTLDLIPDLMDFSLQFSDLGINNPKSLEEKKGSNASYQFNMHPRTRIFKIIERFPEESANAVISHFRELNEHNNLDKIACKFFPSSCRLIFGGEAGKSENVRNTKERVTSLMVALTNFFPKLFIPRLFNELTNSSAENCSELIASILEQATAYDHSPILECAINGLNSKNNNLRTYSAYLIICITPNHPKEIEQAIGSKLTELAKKDKCIYVREYARDILKILKETKAAKKKK